MVDRLTLYLAKSIAKHLEDNVAGLDDAYVVSADFDYDKKPDPTNPREKITRALPFVGIEIVEDERTPFSMSANILYEANMIFNIGMYASNVTPLLNFTGDMKQILVGAVHPVSGEVGIPLFDFGTPSGVFFDLVGAVEIFDPGISNYFGPSGTEEFNNRKHRSTTPVTFSAFKDKNAILLENLGNININD